MTIYEEIKLKLEESPRFRERRFKDETLVEMIKGKYMPERECNCLFFPANKLIDFARDFVSYDRLYRQCLMENPELRGEDYEDGKRLSQEKQIELGYEPDFARIKKKLENL